MRFLGYIFRVLKCSTYTMAVQSLYYICIVYLFLFRSATELQFCLVFFLLFSMAFVIPSSQSLNWKNTNEKWMKSYNTILRSSVKLCSAICFIFVCSLLLFFSLFVNPVICTAWAYRNPFFTSANASSISLDLVFLEKINFLYSSPGTSKYSRNIISQDILL